ncbi:hypothetical protein I4U23_010546 [Adineta vaga]|nr:hypothetical protein I4U23_010546 [Adineta vaga]
MPKLFYPAFQIIQKSKKLRIIEHMRTRPQLHSIRRNQNNYPVEHRNFLRTRESVSDRNTTHHLHDSNGIRFTAHEPSDSSLSDSDIFQQPRSTQQVNLSNPSFSTLNRHSVINHNSVDRSNVNTPAYFYRRHYYDNDIPIGINTGKIFQDNQQMVPSNKSNSRSSSVNGRKSSSETLFTVGTPSNYSNEAAEVPAMYL